MGHEVFSEEDFCFRIKVLHWQTTDSNKLLQLLPASGVQLK